MFNVKKINSEELIEWKNINKEFQFIDIRKNKPAINFHYSEIVIPYDEIQENISKLKKEIPVILACDVGEQSFFSAATLKNKYNFDNIYTLRGGINDLKKQLLL